MGQILFTVFFVLMSQLAHSEVLEFAVFGDGGEKTDEQVALRQSLVNSSVRRIVMPGDNLYGGTYEKAWSDWYDTTPKNKFEFSAVAIGNHHDGYDKEMDFFSKLNPRLFPNKRDYYAVTYGAGSVVFLVLNSDNKKNVGEQMGWLETQLKNVTAPHVFLMYHHPTYDVTEKHEWEERPEFQTKIRPILRTYQQKITALLVGHDHVAALFKFGDLLVIVSGAAQDIRDTDSVLGSYTYKKKGPGDEDLVVEQLWSFKDENPYWAKLTLDTSDPVRSTVQMIRAPFEEGKKKNSLAPHSLGAEPVFLLKSFRPVAQNKSLLPRKPASKKKSN